MLEHLPPVVEAFERWRLGQSNFSSEALAEMGVNEDDFAAVFEYFQLEDLSPEGHLDWLFDGRPKQSGSRFTDGTIPVLYTAREVETAIAEKARWISALPGATAYQQLLRIEVEGQTKDLCTLDPRPECLTGEAATGAYELCFAVAKEAVAEGLDGFHTPSARRHDGVCTPVIRRQAIKTMVLQRHVRFDYNQQASTWDATLL
ncbi:MAG: RES family NAD+ phosphorylase [Proteobacteria bacterium]|nr:RES family NAD+ phosphorylase [Pseudomonadota bacterium]